MQKSTTYVSVQDASSLHEFQIVDRYRPPQSYQEKSCKNVTFLLYETINLKSSRTTEPNYKILFDPFLKIGRVNYHACLRLQTNLSVSKFSTPNPIFDLSAFYDIFIKNF